MQSADVNGCHIRNEDLNLVFNYSTTKLDLTQTQNQDVIDLLPCTKFAALAEEFSSITVQGLDVDSFPRIGFRLWTLYETESLEDASSRINDMSFFSPSKALLKLGEQSHLSHSVVIARKEFMVRTAVSPFEQQINLAPSVLTAAKQKARSHWKDQKTVLIQKMKAEKAIKAYPNVGIMIDMDAFIEDVPYPAQVTAKTFVEEANRDFDVIRNAILIEEDHQ